VTIETSKFSILERPYAIAILVTIEKEGPHLKSVLYSRVSKSTNAPRNRVNELVDAGLLTEEISEYPPLSKTIDLTPKGRKIAEKLVEIEKELEG
jgi:DNA-binding HxlR family transcriptional regulator